MNTWIVGWSCKRFFWKKKRFWTIMLPKVFQCISVSGKLYRLDQWVKRLLEIFSLIYLGVLAHCFVEALIFSKLQATDWPWCEPVKCPVDHEASSKVYLVCVVNNNVKPQLQVFQQDIYKRFSLKFKSMQRNENYFNYKHTFHFPCF